MTDAVELLDAINQTNATPGEVGKALQLLAYKLSQSPIRPEAADIAENSKQKMVLEFLHQNVPIDQIQPLTAVH